MDKVSEMTEIRHCEACGQVKFPSDHWQRKLAALKEQYRVLEDELLVLGDERNAAEARSNLLACALRALLSKCPDCGGTGEVGTGIIQIGQPAQMPCFVCAGEREILLRECGK
jgi:hypothetical protein